ncbi:MAG: ABC transporter substrate-binding protein [Actinomycetota bacterium]|nr:ABC transporter substrate-binding protein [Actinomycetota bacterium]
MLFGIAIAAVLQVGPGGDPSAIALVADPEPSTAVAEETAPSDTSEDVAPTTTAPEPFAYRIGVLAGVTTENFWAFYGDQPSVWNSYILGPTKVALYSLAPGTGILEPELATETVTPSFDSEGWRVRVPLREDLSWSDGSPITADDVVFTFETVRSLGLGGSWSEAFPTVIESVHADSDYELRIEFSERPTLGIWPHGPGLAPVMSSGFWSGKLSGLDAAALYELSGADDPASGPLNLQSVEDNLLISNANPGYGLTSTPDIVEYHVFSSEEEAVTALEQDQIDYVLSPKGLTAAHAERLGADTAMEVTNSPANGVRYLGFNLNRAPMSDQAFRAALALLVDRNDIANEIPTGATVANSFVSSANVKWFSPDGASANEVLFSGDVASRLSRALIGLRAAGYTWEVEPQISADGVISAGSGLLIDGVAPAPLTILTPGDEYDPSRPIHAATIAEALGLLGFDARPVETDFDTVVDLAFTADEDGLLHYDMYLLGWTLGNPTWPGYYRPLFSTTGAVNNTGYSSQAFEQALAAYESASTVEDASVALWAMESVLAADLPYLLLYTSEITEAFRSDRVSFGHADGLGGIQARLGGVLDVSPAD